jgi:hypothetical protein
VPIGFPSLSHGEIAFGFFNIETDLLLLENCFFFAPFFCSMVTKVAEAPSLPQHDYGFPGYVIEHIRDMGNLMGAIHGVDLMGFIGSVYRLFPFPRSLEEFKQNPQGAEHRAAIEGLLEHWAIPTKVPVTIETGSLNVRLAGFLFCRDIFQQLVAYVWEGGMPGWKDGIRPAYVAAMGKTIRGTTSPVFQGLAPKPPAP